MRDALAFIVFVIVWIVVFTAIRDQPPEAAYGKTICANMTCYYEIKDQKR